MKGEKGNKFWSILGSIAIVIALFGLFRSCSKQNDSSSNQHISNSFQENSDKQNHFSDSSSISFSAKGFGLADTQHLKQTTTHSTPNSQASTLKPTLVSTKNSNSSNSSTQHNSGELDDTLSKITVNKGLPLKTNTPINYSATNPIQKSTNSKTTTSAHPNTTTNPIPDKKSLPREHINSTGHIPHKQHLQNPSFKDSLISHHSEPASAPKLEIQLADDEVYKLDQELEPEKFRKLATKVSLSDSTYKGVGTDNNLVAENSGSSYFNASVQANMNDQMKSVFTAKVLYDSVIASSNKDFVYNTLTLSNNTANRLELQVIIAGPSSWQMITPNVANITLEAFANTIIPMRFTPSGNNTASWQQVRIEYRFNTGVMDSRKTFYKIKVQEYSNFKGSLPNSNLVLTSYQKNTSFPVYLKNAGNTPGHYKVSAANQLLKFNANIELTLRPGRDTTISLPITISESQYSLLRKEDIRISLTSDKKEVINLIQSVSKIGFILRDHQSAFLEMPLQFEVGAMYSGKDAPLQYYGALYGTLDFSEYDRVTMSFRSNTYAQGQTNNNSIARLDYTGKNFSASAGNIQGAGEFMVDGYGARLGYDWKARNKAEVFAMLKSRVGDTKVGGAALQMSLNDNLRISDALSVRRDNVTGMNSAIISQLTDYKLKDGRLTLITGIGAEKNDGHLQEGAKRFLLGTSFGYNFQYNTKKLAVSSNVLMNSNSYPGTFKGQRVQQHDVRWLLKNNFIGGYYEYNMRRSNYWQDTLYFDNVFNIQTSNVGVRGGISFRNNSLALGIGNQKQKQEGEGTYNTNFDYLNLTLSSLLFKKLFININNYTGYMSVTNSPSPKVPVTTSQGSIQYKSFGTAFRFDYGPYYYQDLIGYLHQEAEYNRLILGPYAEVKLLKKALSVRLQGNYARSMPDNNYNASVLTNINYATKAYDFTINGILPLGGAGSNNAYLNTAFRMRIKAPFVPVRKFYNLNLVLFKDMNSNGIKDKGEEAVAGQTLSLNGDLFVSDGNGMVIYKNTEKGAYKADFGFSSKLKGWMPAGGTIQYFELKGNRTIEIPYKVSRVLSGKLMIEKDSLSNADFNPHNIKVIATGEAGEQYATLTDDAGEFYFNLPSGKYIVTLSDAAFTDQFKPTQSAIPADLINNQNKHIYFEIRQKKRQINIKRK
ncbi:MAG: hypothetical protein JST88_09630 [Bacteroidetes bacterium]|nr:hypothetical protein [Bacteroidota bacterium]